MSRPPRHRDPLAPRLAAAALVALGLHGLGVPAASGWLGGHRNNEKPGKTSTPPPDESPVDSRSEPSPTTTPAPDLEPSQPKVPTRLALGTTTPLRFTVTNIGETDATMRESTSAAAPWWTDAVYLSGDAALDDDDTRLATADALPRLSRAGSYQAAFEVTLSEDAPLGRAYLLLVTDDADDVDEAGLEANNVLSVAVDLRPADEAPPEPVLGDATAAPRITVAWISHDAFEQLRAGPTPSQTIQPAIQRDASAVPDAPLRAGQATPAPPPPPADATAPSPPAEPSAPSPPELAAVEASPPAADLVEAPALDAEPLLADAAEASEQPEIPPAEAADAQETEPPAETLPPPAPPSDAASPTPSAPPADPAEPRPSSAPQGDTDADAADLKPVPVFQAGRVEVAEGLTVTPSRPDFSVPALVTAIPRNPRVRITFDVDGRVIQADLLDSAGSDMLDAPIRASLYRWKASGDRLATWDGPRQFTFTILLIRPRP